MTDGQELPAATGLFAGILMVILFTAMINSPTESTIFPKSNNVHAVIEGLKDSYHRGEQIHFDVRVAGYGYYCQSPNGAIWNASLFLKAQPVWRSGLPTVSCDNESQAVHRYVDDKYDWSAYQDIRIDAIGNYTLGVRLGEPLVYKQFTVIP